MSYVWRGMSYVCSQYCDSSDKITGDFNRFYGYPTTPSASAVAHTTFSKLFGPRGGSITNQ